MSAITCAAVVQRDGKLVDESITLPVLESHQLLVKVHAAAFNPTDRLALDVNAFDDGAVLGCDFAGVVVAIGAQVSSWKIGDRIASLVWGGEIPSKGAYSLYCIAEDKISYRVSEELSFEQAATVPLAINTAWLALLSSDCLYLSRTASSSNQTLLVWGGSTAVGAYAIELAVYLGIEVVAVCSPSNFEAVKSLGASQVFDYHLSDVVARIREAAPTISHVFDTVGSVTSSAIAASCITISNGKLCTVRPGKANTSEVPKTVEVSDVFVFTAFSKEHSYRGAAFWPINIENCNLSAELYALIPDLLSDGRIHPRPVQRLGKLSAASVTEAMDLNRQGKVSNAKLCFEV